MDNENLQPITEETETQETVEVEETSVEKPRKKKRRKVRMNFMYKIAFVLFCIAFVLLVASMVICLVEDHPDSDSFYAILFSRISAGLAVLGVIFACVSKTKKPKVKKEKKQKHKKEDE